MADWPGSGLTRQYCSMTNIAYRNPFLPHKENNNALVNHNYGIKGGIYKSF